MQEKIYFGTYTRRESKGIYTADIDLTTGSLSNLEVFAEEPSPTYMSFDKAGHVYAVGAEDGLGGIAAFSKEGALLNHVVEEGAPLCYTAVDEKRDLVYGANYHLGEVRVYKRNPDGSLAFSDKDVQDFPTGPHKNQDHSHVHYSDLTPDNFLITCNLGTDQVVTYGVHEGKLSKVNTYYAKPGAGARHITFHPTEKIAYLMCELDGTVEVLIYDGLGSFELMQKITTLPGGVIPEGYLGAAAIRLSKDGKFLYTSNRGFDAITVFEIAADGTLALAQIIETQGSVCRDFNLTTDNNWLIAGHQNSDNITVFKRDSETGLLSLISSDFVVPECVNVAVK